MPDLSIEVREREIIVTNPSQGLQVSYRKLGKSPMLVSDDPMCITPSSDELKFLVRAWRAALAKKSFAGFDFAPLEPWLGRID
jgi:hypothetical protein